MRQGIVHSHAPVSRGLKRFGWSGLLVILNLVVGRSWGQTDSADVRIYDPDPHHVLNRLHGALFVRKAHDGQFHGHDVVDPLIWRESTYFLKSPFHERAVRLLKELLSAEAGTSVGDPAKRAILQHDFWILFDVLRAGQNAREPAPTKQARDTLQGLVAAAIRHVALTSEEISKLPDNYLGAVASRAFADDFDETNRETPFLPPDLFDPTGPWICLGRPDGVVAPEHVREGSGVSRSAFLVFLRLPGDRHETLDYLKRLESFRGPMWVQKKGKWMPNPKVPAFSPGTQMALVRRLMAIDSEGSILPTAITQSVQLRVYRETPGMDFATYLTSRHATSAPGRLEKRQQGFFEFRLVRANLFANEQGGLVAVGIDDREYSAGFNNTGVDYFEVQGPPMPILRTCIACHTLPAVWSFNSYLNFRGTRPATEVRPAALSEMAISRVLQAYIEAKEAQSDWKQLKNLLPGTR